MSGNNEIATEHNQIARIVTAFFSTLIGMAVAGGIAAPNNSDNNTSINDDPEEDPHLGIIIMFGGFCGGIVGLAAYPAVKKVANTVSWIANTGQSSFTQYRPAEEATPLVNIADLHKRNPV